MNKENAHLFLPLVQALADGKTIQRKLPHCKFVGTNPDGTSYLEDSPEEWIDGGVGGFAFNNNPEFYRIKPEPRTFEMWYYRPTGRMYPWVEDEKQYVESDEWERITVQEVLK
jgi:hypothetical protein